jgi:hypothetical protein
MTRPISTSGSTPAGLLRRWWATWDRWWLAPQPIVSLGLLRLLTFATLLWYLGSEYAWVIRLESVDTWFYRPILAFELLGIGPIPPGLASLMLPVLVACAILGLLGVLARCCAAVCGLAYLYAIGQVYSFTNVHHGDGLLGLVLLVLALSPSGAALAVPTPWNRSARVDWRQESAWAGWPIRFVRVQVALVYFLAGYAKIVLSGPVWMDGASLQHYLILRGQPIGYWLASQPLLCAALSAVTVVWELSFPLVLVWPRLRWAYVPTAIIFHLVSQHVLGVGFMYFWPFLLAYADPRWLERWWPAKGVRLASGPHPSVP